jgi:hypothetical protein
MNEFSLDKNEEKILMCEIPDAALENAACTGNNEANTFTQWICTALDYCPGP